MKKVISCYYLLGKYASSTKMFEDYINSFREHFCCDCDLFFLVITDNSDLLKNLDRTDDIIFKLVDQNLDPHDIKRKKFHYILKFEDELRKFDYIHYANCNLRCNQKIYLSDLITKHEITAVTHPERCKPFRSLQQNIKNSSIYISNFNNNMTYHQAGNFIATSDNFLKLYNICNDLMKKDISNDIYTRWHDETYFNYYLNCILKNENFNSLNGRIFLFHKSHVPSHVKMYTVDKVNYIDRKSVV